MAYLSSDSSGSDSEPDVPQNTVENSDSHLDLNTVNECIREYEKEQKKERKKRFDAGVKTETVIMSPEEILSKIKLTPSQVKKLQAKERSEKQKQQLAEARAKANQAKLEAKKNLDLRADKSKPGVTIQVKPVGKPRGRNAPKAKPEPVEESEEDEPLSPPTQKKFQAKKPKMEDEDELDQKMAKLNKLNQVIESNNPWLARILESRGRR